MLRSVTSLFSTKYHVSTRNSCYLRTYFLLIHCKSQGVESTPKGYSLSVSGARMTLL
jgi:hypothetical protein